MKPFRFQQFSIQQSKDVFRVGTDGVLLGAMCNVKNAKKILEIGTGTGLISLMLAQRNVSAKISAIDINENAVKLASENFRNSIFNENLKVELKDFKNFETNENFDLVVCNPPFFEENASAKDVLARQQVELNFRNLVEKSTEIITKKGILSIILPSEAATDVKSLAEEFNLYLVREINIFGIEGGNLKRNILEFSLAQKPLEISDFVIEKKPREYSDQYLNLTKNFHVFGK
ncbi:MAG: methyltransferase [Cloacibacterium sp.]|nr:methyltransferase [Cloacibacterium sp.]